MCCEDSTCELTRKELVTILLESQEHLFARKFNHLLTRLIELTNCPDDGVKILKKKLKGFKNKFTSKLRDVHNIMDRFLHDNQNWLTTSMTFPLWRRNKPGRPRKASRHARSRRSDGKRNSCSKHCRKISYLEPQESLHFQFRQPRPLHKRGAAPGSSSKGRHRGKL